MAVQLCEYVKIVCLKNTMVEFAWINNIALQHSYKHS